MAATIGVDVAGKQVAEKLLQLTATGKLIGAYRLRLLSPATKGFEMSRSTFYELLSVAANVLIFDIF